MAKDEYNDAAKAILRKWGCDALRRVAKHRLAMWDAATQAEELLGIEVVTQSDEMDARLIAGDVDAMSEAELLELFTSK